jgi:hypothetical protein
MVDVEPTGVPRRDEAAPAFSVVSFMFAPASNAIADFLEKQHRACREAAWLPYYSAGTTSFFC